MDVPPRLARIGTRRLTTACTRPRISENVIVILPLIVLIGGRAASDSEQPTESTRQEQTIHALISPPVRIEQQTPRNSFSPTIQRSDLTPDITRREYNQATNKLTMTLSLTRGRVNALI